MKNHLVILLLSWLSISATAEAEVVRFASRPDSNKWNVRLRFQLAGARASDIYEPELEGWRETQIALDLQRRIVVYERLRLQTREDWAAFSAWPWQEDQNWQHYEDPAFGYIDFDPILIEVGRIEPMGLRQNTPSTVLVEADPFGHRGRFPSFEVSGSYVIENAEARVSGDFATWISNDNLSYPFPQDYFDFYSGHVLDEPIWTTVLGSYITACHGWSMRYGELSHPPESLQPPAIIFDGMVGSNRYSIEIASAEIIYRVGFLGGLQLFAVPEPPNWLAAMIALGMAAGIWIRQRGKRGRCPQ